MGGKSIFVMDLSGVQSVLMAGISLTLQLCVESWGTQPMVSQAQFTFKTSNYYHLALYIGAQPIYYSPDANNAIVIENVNCSWDELRLRDCPYYSNHTISHTSCQSGGVAGVRCKIIRNIGFSTVNNSVLVTWEYNNIISHQLSSFDIRCNGHNSIISVSNGTSRVSVGHLLPNASYDCCVSVNYARTTFTELRCASIRSEDLLTSTDTFIISGTCANMMVTVYIVGAVLGCVIVILLVLLAVCGGALLRSRTSESGVAHKRYIHV